MSRGRIATKVDGRMLSWRNVSAEEETPHLLVVSYFTDSFYMREAYELVRSCQRFNLHYVVEQVFNHGSWEANTRYKPAYLLLLHHRYPNSDLLWLDADARIRREPTALLDGSCLKPVALHWWQDRVCASGTVLLRACSEREALLKAWIEEVDTHQYSNDQEALERAIIRSGVSTFDLPVEYCWIYDGNSLNEPDPTSCPVIEHLQASRYTKKKGKRVDGA